ncbi:MAG: MFS transporter [Chloroflexi bacterium]|nr:MFS transporter [Chloroflexota bacterium]
MVAFLHSRTLESLEVRDFRWLWISSMAAFVAMQMQMVARGWLVYDLTESPMALAWVMASMALPMSVFSLVGGAIMDRVPKRNLLGWSLLGSATITVAVAVLIHKEQIAFWHLLVAGVLNGAVISVQMPGRYSFISQLVGDSRLVNANALLNAGMNLSRIASPALAGVLIGVIGTAGVYDIMVVCYIFGALAVFVMRHRGEPVGRSIHSVAYDVREGLVYVRGNKVVLALLVMSFVPMLFGLPYIMLLPAFAVEALDVGADGLGILMAITGVGAILGSLMVAYLGNFRYLGLLFFVSVVFWGITLAGLSQATGLLVAVMPLMMIGMASAVFMSINISLIQVYTASDMRGRVMGISMWTFSMMPVGLIPVSLVAEMAGTSTAYLGSAVMLMVTSMALFMVIPALRQLRPIVDDWSAPAPALATLGSREAVDHQR